MSAAPLPAPRSSLFVPGNRPERFARALAAGADQVVIDLEDAVPPDAKHDARAQVADWLSPGHPVVLRINAVDTAWFAGDLMLLKQPGVAGVMLPKAERSDDILALPRGLKIYPLIETARGFDLAREIAQVQGVQCLVFGSIDFQLDLGIRGDGEELLFFRSRLVLVSRLAGIAAPVDGVCTSIEDDALLRVDARRARRLGFGGKLCIHPRQVATVNAAFSPSDEEIAWARRVLEAARASEGAAVAVDGKMVDRPVILEAEAIIAAASSPGNMNLVAAP